MGGTYPHTDPEMKLPEFAQGIHYEELRGSHPHSHGDYRFRLLADVTLQLSALALHTRSISFRDAKRNEWARIDGDKLTIRRCYAWNGASPKWWLLGRWMGTPDFEPTRLATLVHDVCFQFLRVADWPLQIDACNTLFYQIMVQQNFKLANTYFGAVTDFGERFAGKYPRQGEHSVVL